MRRAVRRTLWIAVALDRLEDARVGREAAEIATLIHLPSNGHSQTFDAVRAFIYANTVADGDFMLRGTRKNLTSRPRGSVG